MDYLDNEKYRIAVENSTDCVFEYDIASDIFRAIRTDRGENDKSQLEVEGYLAHLPSLHFVYPEDYETAGKMMRGEIQRCEIRLYKNTDSEKFDWFSYRGSVIREGGRPVRIIGTLIDIGELKEIQHKREDADRRFMLAVNSLYDLIYEFNLTEGRIEVWKSPGGNLLFADSTKCISDFVEEVAEKYIHPDYAQQYRRLFDMDWAQEALKSGRTGEYLELPRLMKGGQYHWFSVQTQLSRSGKDLILMVFFKDVNEVRRKEKEKQDALRDALALAEEANKAKTDFLSRMSHDIRTPMNAIIGMTAIAGSSVNSPEKTAYCLEKIGLSSRYLLTLINDILDMSKIESGKMTVSREEFDIHALIQQVTTLTIARSEGKKHEISVHVDEHVQRMYIGDSLRLSQVLMNLCGNAVKYTPEGGSISLDVTVIGQKKETALLRFRIQDSGVGMSSDFMDHMYEPFEQEQTAYTGGMQGSGLGLSIARNLVHLMSGHIYAESKPGEGSCFTVELPLGMTEQDIQAYGQLEDLSVLIVDDDVVTCEYTEKILQSMNVKARWVTSGAEALRTVERDLSEPGNLADIVIIDWRMPEMDGVETARRIRKLVGEEALVIVISAYDWSQIEEDALAAGVDYFLSKPIFKEDLYEVLKKAMHKEAKIHKAEAGSITFHGEKILLAEDNDMNREIACTLLEMAGLTVEAVVDGQQAVEVYKQAPDGYFKAVVLDIRMPVMNGLEAAKEIRATDRGDAASIPIVAMSANAFQDEKDEARLSGMNEYLTKPVDTAQLYGTLYRLIYTRTSSEKSS